MARVSDIRGGTRAIGARVVAALVVAGLASCVPHGIRSRQPELTRAAQRRLFIMFSAPATRDLPDLVGRYVRPRDYVRFEALPSLDEMIVPRVRRYVLPATIRKTWAGEPGIRHWLARRCARSVGTVVYDPERWELTPRREQRQIARAVRRGAAIVRATGCHDFGIAPDGVSMFGMHPERCRYDLRAGAYRRLPWKAIDIVDIQAQLLLSDGCVGALGVDHYARVVSSIARWVRRHGPRTDVVAQVSFRHTPPERMQAAIARVAQVVDGIYFSYPSNGPGRCRYCAAERLRALLRFLRE